MIDLDNEIIKHLIIKPTEIIGFEEYIKNIPTHGGVRIYRLPVDDEGKIKKHSIYEFSQTPESSPRCFFQEVCNSFDVFYQGLMNVVNNENLTRKKRYEACHAEKYERDGLSYAHYLCNEWESINTEVFEFLDKEGTKFFEDKNGSIPFVWDEYKEMFLPVQNKSPSQQSKLVTLAKSLKTNLEKYLRLAAICQAFEFYFLFKFNTTGDYEYRLCSQVLYERKHKCLYAAENQRLSLEHTLVDYYNKYIKAKGANKTKAEQGRRTKELIQENLNSLAKEKKYDGFELIDIYRNIMRSEAHNIKIPKGNSNSEHSEYLELRTIKHHISTIIKKLN